MSGKTRPPICDYEGSDYQTRFWEKGGREYEDRCEAIALRRLLPTQGGLLLELGAGAGRNTARYTGFERVVLLDYSRTQLKQAQALLGTSDKYVFVAADIYRLPFKDGLFDAATMIRVIHHMADAPAALRQIRGVLKPGAIFILEFANKRNWKSVFRYFLSLQSWNPFSYAPVEYAPLNFDFHPRTLQSWLKNLDFRIEKTLCVSNFRIGILKKIIPPEILAGLDSLVQWTAILGQFSPSVFLRSRVPGRKEPNVNSMKIVDYFKCPECSHETLQFSNSTIHCPACDRKWNITEGIYDFRGDDE